MNCYLIEIKDIASVTSEQINIINEFIIQENLDGPTFICNDNTYKPSYFSIGYTNIVNNLCHDAKILDLYSGIGMTGMLLSLSNEQVDCADIDDTAINFMQMNKDINHFDHVNIIKSNIFDNITSTYDYILANPPMLSYEDYNDIVEEERKKLIPTIAYIAGEDRDFHYKNLFSVGKNYLNDHGSIILPMPNDIKGERLVQMVKNDYNWSSAEYIQWPDHQEDEPVGYLIVTK